MDIKIEICEACSDTKCERMRQIETLQDTLHLPMLPNIELLIPRRTTGVIPRHRR
jgi:hypothetical protein